MMEYKGYLGAVNFDDEDNVFHGRVLGVRDMVTFEGTSVNELRRAFRDSVDDYLEFCASRGEEPNRPFSGEFVMHVRPELHRTICIRAALEDKSLNAWICERLQEWMNASQGDVNGGHSKGNRSGATRKRDRRAVSKE